MECGVLAHLHNPHQLSEWNFSMRICEAHHGLTVLRKQDGARVLCLGSFRTSKSPSRSRKMWSQTCGLWPLGGSSNAFTGVAYQLVTVWFVTVAKLQLWGSRTVILWPGLTTWGTVLKHGSFRKVESHCPQWTMYGYSPSVGTHTQREWERGGCCVAAALWEPQASARGRSMGCGDTGLNVFTAKLQGGEFSATEWAIMRTECRKSQQNRWDQIVPVYPGGGKLTLRAWSTRGLWVVSFCQAHL